MLKDEADSALGRTVLRGLLAMKKNRSIIRRFKPRDDPQKCCLSRSRRPKERHQLTTANRQTDVGKRGERAVLLANMLDLDAHDLTSLSSLCGSTPDMTSMTFLSTMVTIAANVSSDAAAKAAVKLYSL